MAFLEHLAAFAANPAGSTINFTQTVSAGSNRIAFILCGGGYRNGKTDSVWPATLTWGGQTINRGLTHSDNNADAACYVAYESDIAALSSGSGSITLDETGALGTEGYVVSILVYEDVNQTLADSDSVLDGTSRTLTTTSGDICMGAAMCRGSETPTTTDTERFSANSGTNIGDCNALGWDETASTTSTVVDVGGSPSRLVLFAYAMTPEAATAGTSTILQQHG